MKQPIYFKTLLLCMLFILSFARSFSQTTIIANNANWKYYTETSAPANDGQGDTWKVLNFDDASWLSGPAELGFGDGSEATVTPSGNWTTYFRTTVNIASISGYSNFTFNLVRDDGAVVYVNGVEAFRSNMNTGTVSHTTPAATTINGGGESAVNTYTVPTSMFVVGNNVIAVEVHQSALSSTDLSFKLEVLANAPAAATLTRGPYLQMANQTAITIRWRTGSGADSKVELGTSYGTYPIVVTDASSVTEHIIRVTGLTPDTKYYYRIGSTTTQLQGGTDNFFTTNPPTTTTRKIRIAAFGDCGRNSATYQDENLTNYRNYLTTNGIDAPDAWILMGDNAYSSGTDAEYTTNFFGIYGSNLLKNHKIYPAPGNHDYGNNTANKPSRTMPYYNNFTTPQNAECGGVASNKPNFYSFDVGPIHFLSLDSWGTETDLTYMGINGSSQIKTWVDADLAANTQKWTIAYWHHPPYTKTSHNSDTETELVNIRQNFITYLEARGVDLIICGHSHGYERGYMLRNFTTGWTTFNPATHAVSTSSAEYTSNTTCPYVYNSTPLNHGTVYVVAGSAGASGGVQTDFDAYAFPFSVNDGGVLYFEVEDNRLDAKMLRRNGTIFDRFTIMKDVNKTQSYNIVNGSSITLTASWPADLASNYTWSNASNGRSITVTPPLGTTNYTVTDNYGCVTDNITVNVLSMLPVDLSRFTVNLVKDKVNINWTTASENHSRYFTVERSMDGANFEQLARVQAAGTSSDSRNYSATDNHPLRGNSYYRLIQTDVDGRMKMSDIKKISNASGSSFDARLAISGNVVTISLLSTQRDKISLRIYDMSGREVDAKSWSVDTGSTQGQIRLSRGSYILTFRTGSNESIVRKIVIE
jgi:acid phosphatase type 7